MKIQSTSALAMEVARNPELREQIRADPLNGIANVAAPLQTDVWIYRMVVGALGLLVLIAIGGAVYLASTKVDVPDALISLGSAAVGALTGLLAPSPATTRGN